MGAIAAIVGGVALRTGDVTSEDAGRKGNDGLEDGVFVEGGMTIL